MYGIPIAEPFSDRKHSHPKPREPMPSGLPTAELFRWNKMSITMTCHQDQHAASSIRTIQYLILIHVLNACMSRTTAMADAAVNPDMPDLNDRKKPTDNRCFSSAESGSFKSSLASCCSLFSMSCKGAPRYSVIIRQQAQHLIQPGDELLHTMSSLSILQTISGQRTSHTFREIHDDH